MSRSRLVLLFVGFALSALVVFVLVRSIDLGQAIASLKHASPAWLVLAALVALVGYYFRALRWGEVLSPRARPRVARLFSATVIGFLAINVLPARIGELVRAYTLARTERLSTATVLGSVAVERVLDLGALGIFWALSLFFAPLPEWFRVSGYATLGIGVAGGLVLWVLMASHQKLLRPDGALASRLPRRLREGLIAALPEFTEGLQAFRRPALLARAAVWSLLAWSAGGAAFLGVGESLGMRLPYWTIFFMSFIVSVGVMIPSSPGFVGVLEGACVVGLSALGVAGPEALAFGILYHLVQLVPLAILGTLFALREHVLPVLLRPEEAAREGLERKN
jgi:glycosyltransferase 2 family protein